MKDRTFSSTPTHFPPPHTHHPPHPILTTYRTQLTSHPPHHAPHTTPYQHPTTPTTSHPPNHILHTTPYPHHTTPHHTTPHHTTPHHTTPHHTTPHHTHHTHPSPRTIKGQCFGLEDGLERGGVDDQQLTQHRPSHRQNEGLVGEEADGEERLGV